MTTQPVPPFGGIRRLRSGRWHARYTGPTGHRYNGHTEYGEPLTFANARDACTWLGLVQADIVRQQWRSPDELRGEAQARRAAEELTFTVYAQQWIEWRSTGCGKDNLEVRTRRHYEYLMERFITPLIGDRPLGSLRPRDIREWHARVGRMTGPSGQAHAYQLVNSVLRTAVREEVIDNSPARIKGASKVKRAITIEPATQAELDIIVAAVPDFMRLMVKLAAWCALRSGELAELRRRDIDLAEATVRITRAVARTPQDGAIVKRPKSQAGIRVVNIPPHLMGDVRTHLMRHVEARRDALLFPARRTGEQMRQSAIYYQWNKARTLAERPDLRFHDLRHTGAVNAARTGATVAELMGRLGHSSSEMAMAYQHAAKGRDREIAERMSEMAGYPVERRDDPATG